MSTNKPSEKQISNIIYLWENSPRESFKKYWRKIPKYNAKYKYNAKVDYRREIAGDWLMTRTTRKQASYMIDLLQECERGTSYRFYNLLLSLNK